MTRIPETWRITGDAVKWLLRAAVFLVLALVGLYVSGEETHEADQDKQLANHERRIRAGELERRDLKRDVDDVRRGVQWLVNRRAEEIGEENLSEPPPVVDPATATRSGGGSG